MVKTHYSKTPAKGTAMRALLLMMLRPQGMTRTDTGVLLPHAFGYPMQYFVDQCGWDIRKFYRPNPKYAGQPRVHKKVVVYRIVGKYRWDGTYRSFIDPTKVTEGLT